MAQSKGNDIRKQITLSPAGLRATYAKFIEPGSFKNSPDKRYGASFIIPGLPKDNSNPDFLLVKKTVLDMAREMWPGNTFSITRLTQEQVNAGNVIEINVPWKDGTMLADAGKANGKNYEMYRGNTILKVSSKFPAQLLKPGPRNADGTASEAVLVPLTNPEEAKALFYSGGYYAAGLELHGYGPSNGKPGGIGVWAQSLFFIKHGEPLNDGGNSQVDRFKGYAGTMSSENPTSGSGEEF